MNPFNPMPRTPVVSCFVVISEHGTRFTGRWPTEESARCFCATLGHGARIEQVTPYEHP